MSKPTITLKIGGGSTPGFNLSRKSPSTAGTPTPGSGAPKIRLNMSNGSKPTTPSEIVVKPLPKTKAGRASKPSAKAAANKNGKRIKDESDDGDDNKSRTVAERAPKKLKLSLGGPKAPTVLKAKFKGKPPKRPLGEGYDSEASDREEDPLVVEEFILRMIPGPDCDYVREAIQEKTIGVPRHQNGADIQMKFIHTEGRRAILTVRKHHYAATLVDLPCVIEGMKSWDKRGWWKSADICQMLLVFAPIKTEAEAATIELPKIVDPHTFQYPHGLTPPMHFARKRRFRKRISRTAIEAVEDAVEKLLEADLKAESIRHELIEPEVRSRQGSRSFGSPLAYDEEEGYSEDEDAEGDIDDGTAYYGHINGNGMAKQEEGEEHDLDADLEADLEAAFEADFDIGTPASNAIAETPIATIATGTPDASGNVNGDSGDESSDASVEDDEADGGSGDEIDDDERARLAQLQGAKEDIDEMEKQLASLQASWEMQVNPILKTRIKGNIEKVKAELQLKKSAIGEGDED
ncbi:hypothetical protein VE02_06658 [Pseudogymnoascus sp. 03VT05]|nr:hypothetical protein VE02_06658 [Pseudogymnoascus sp. 03VT05]